MQLTTRLYPEDYLNCITNTLKLWTEYIKTNKNFSFIKFGDGEFYCMMGSNGANCDNHPYSSELQDKLNKAWNYYCTDETHNIFIAEWADQPGSFGTPQNIVPQKNSNNPVFTFYHQITDNKKLNFKLVNFEILLQNTLTQQKYNFFKSIKETDRKKVFVGPERLSQVQQFLNISTHIQVPLLNTFSKYNEILEQCKKVYSSNTIYIFSSGMPTKAIIYELLETYNDITCLDTGSGFDALFVGGTREGQLDKETLLHFYKDLL
jgi:hypothetical protein